MIIMKCGEREKQQHNEPNKLNFKRNQMFRISYNKVHLIRNLRETLRKIFVEKNAIVIGMEQIIENR